MKKFFFAIALIMVTTFSFCRCNNIEKKGDTHLISLDLNKCSVIELDKNNLIGLETTDSSLIYDICALEYHDGALIINSRDFLRKFDGTSGKYLGDIAKRGEGPGEYSFVARFWERNDTFNVWDNNERLLFHYLPTGEFIGTESPFHNGDSVKSVPQFFIEYPGKGFFTINTFTDGTTAKNPRYSYYDENMCFVRDLPGREMTDGSFMTDRAYYDCEGERILTWEALKDTLFVLTPEQIIPIYAFEFGKYSMPDEIQSKPDFYDRIEMFTDKNADEWASFMRCFQVKDNHLYFSFVTNRFENYLAVMDMKTERARVVKLEDPEKRWAQQTFFKVMDDESILIACNDTTDIEKNPALYKIKLPL